MTFHDQVDTDHSDTGKNKTTAPDQPDDARTFSPVVIIWGILTVIAMLGWAAALGWTAFQLLRWVIG